MSLPLPEPDLDEPGTFEFTPRRALQGRVLNRMALTLRDPAERASFIADEEAYLTRFDLSETELRLVRARDWTGLLRAGGHLQAISKIAAADGGNLWDIGAANVGCTREELVASCPREVAYLPVAAP